MAADAGGFGVEFWELDAVLAISAARAPCPSRESNDTGGADGPPEAGVGVTEADCCGCI